MKILGIETSSPLFSLCLNDDEKVLHEFSRRREVDGHGDAEIFKEAKWILDSVGSEKLGAIGVNIGPGMFTSLRVGLSLAKGIALVKQTPVVAVNALDIIGREPSLVHSPIVAVVNAYRGEIYAALYDNGKRTSDYLLTTPDELLKMIDGRARVISPGVDIFAGVESSHSEIEFVRDDSYMSSAVKVIAAALPRIQRQDFDDIEFLEPYYIKRTDAERNYAKGNAV